MKVIQDKVMVYTITSKYYKSAKESARKEAQDSVMALTEQNHLWTAIQKHKKIKPINPDRHTILCLGVVRNGEEPVGIKVREEKCEYHTEHEFLYGDKDAEGCKRILFESGVAIFG